jgi:hypothetical protein
MIMETYVEPQNVQRNPRGEIIFKLNQKLHFIATKTFTLGAANLQIRAESDVYFDGTKAEIDRPTQARSIILHTVNLSLRPIKVNI